MLPIDDAATSMRRPLVRAGPLGATPIRCVMSRPDHGVCPYCSGCGRSILRGELKLTVTKPPVSQTAGDAVNVGEAMCSGHLRCDLVGPGRTTGPCQAGRLDSTQSRPSGFSEAVRRSNRPIQVLRPRSSRSWPPGPGHLPPLGVVRFPGSGGFRRQGPESRLVGMSGDHGDLPQVKPLPGSSGEECRRAGQAVGPHGGTALAAGVGAAFAPSQLGPLRSPLF